MNSVKLANCDTIAKTLSKLTDDELGVLNRQIQGLPSEQYTGQLARFAKATDELTLVTGLFSKLAEIPVLAAG